MESYSICSFVSASLTHIIILRLTHVVLKILQCIHHNVFTYSSRQLFLVFSNYK